MDNSRGATGNGRWLGWGSASAAVDSAPRAPKKKCAGGGFGEATRHPSSILSDFGQAMLGIFRLGIEDMNDHKVPNRHWWEVTGDNVGLNVHAILQAMPHVFTRDSDIWAERLINMEDEAITVVVDIVEGDTVSLVEYHQGATRWSHVTGHGITGAKKHHAAI